MAQAVSAFAPPALQTDDEHFKGFGSLLVFLKCLLTIRAEGAIGGHALADLDME